MSNSLITNIIGGGQRLPRLDIISTIGREFLTSNIENGEYSYQRDFDEHLTGHYKLDIRFYSEREKVAVLVETKDKKFKKADIDQLMAYVKLEQRISDSTKIIAILAGTHDGSLRVWKIANGYDEKLEDTKLKGFAEYVSYFQRRNINDKTKVLENTSALNRLLHDNGIKENLRSQFVGTCLLALKEGLVYKNLDTPQILAGIKGKLGNLLNNSVDKANKISILDTKVLQDQNVQKIEAENFGRLLSFIKDRILPYINEASTEGHDILSYFFTTFNKYVNREDKNQAFTPNHIAHFMCKVGQITRKTRVLDPTCGSGTFLVQAMAQALAKCETDTERNHVKQQQIYGIEFDKNVFGLATTNMLIHGDGNSNIYCGSCFDKETFIQNADIDLVLMNPPYNASKAQVDQAYAKTWGKSTTDPSKGLYFVEYIANRVGKGRLVTLLPMQAAIGDRGVLGTIKSSMLEHHTLDAVFSFPSEMFYPGASAVACCMVFDLGKPHKDSDKKTFFGYFKDDGFEKRKGVGRVDIKDHWDEIEKTWLDLYERRTTKAGISVTQKVTAKDEWCAEAYMETDYSTLDKSMFIHFLRDYSSFLLKYDDCKIERIFKNTPLKKREKDYLLSTEDWQWFMFGRLIEEPYKAIPYSAYTLTECNHEEPRAIKYITRTDTNNGCAAFVLEEDFANIEEGNAITIGDTTSTIYYQSTPFICGDHIIVIRAPWLNKHTGLFITTLLNKERFRYNYGRAYLKDSVMSTKIKLPIDADGNPDWQFMEDYIKSLPYSANI